jgi:hypothetical protein
MLRAGVKGCASKIEIKVKGTRTSGLHRAHPLDLLRADSSKTEEGGTASRSLITLIEDEPPWLDLSHVNMGWQTGCLVQIG